jgi:hypothetical protein
MRIIRERVRHHETIHRLCYSYGNEGRGFSFPCDEDGKVILSELQEAGLESYKQCLKGSITVWEGVEYKWDGNDHVAISGTGHQVTYPIRGPGHEETEHNWSEPAIGECNHCKQEVELSGFTNTCEQCNTDYNMSGQELADRSQWGEETGESLADILSIP